MRTTVSQIAEIAGFSPATVDRVLNNRGGVRERTCDIILQTARRLGYFGPVEREAEPEVQLDFVLPAGDNTFMILLRQFIVEEASRYPGIRPVLHLYEDYDPDKLAAHLLDLEGKTDAIATVVPDHPAVRQAINRLAASGIRISTLVSDLPLVDKVGYVGIDNRAAGRLAGLLMGRFLPADQEHQVVVFIGSPSYRGHEEREMGFRSILAQDFSNLQISRIIQINDDREQAYQQTRQILTQGPPAAIYNIGSGNQGIGRALAEAGVSRDLVFIAHDLTEATKMMLLDHTLDAVIEQNPRVEAREVIKLLLASINGARESSYPPRLQVVFRENIPYL